MQLIEDYFKLYLQFPGSSDDVNSIRDTDENIIENENVGRHAFAHMTGDQDAISHERLQGKSVEEMRLYEQQKVYVYFANIRLEL